MNVMKKLLLVFMVYTMMNELNAQQNFEGRITWTVITADSSLQLKIDAWFTKDKIKAVTKVIKTSAGATANDETIILDFGNAVIDRVFVAEQKVERQSMKRHSIPALTLLNDPRTVLGHSCTGYTTGTFNNEPVSDSISPSLNSREIRCWYAGDLFFAVPDSLKMMQMVPMFSNGHINLATEMEIRTGTDSFLLRTTAMKIFPSKTILPAALFLYPRNYRLIHNE